MTITILQWNIHGIFNNYNKLTLLIKDHAPDIVFLQETNLPCKSTNFICPNFHNFSYNKQGIGGLIKRNVLHTYRNINSSILYSALQFKFELVFNIVNAYIPPSQIFSSSDISEILQNPTPG